MKRIVAIFMCICLIAASVTIFCAAEYVSIKGTEMEYAVYGDEAAQPLLLLSGNGGDMHGFDGSILPALAQRYRVITVSVRGTGNTKLGTDSLTFEQEAEDLTVLLDELGIEKTNIYGFSDGGNLAIVFAINYPDRVNKLCIQSPNINIAGTKLFTQLKIMWQYFILCIECAMGKGEEYVRQREIKGMMAHQPNLKFEDLEEITAPTLHIYADDDMMYRWHSEKISQFIPNCRSIMIENATHTSSFAQYDTLLLPAITEFFG